MRNCVPLFLLFMSVTPAAAHAQVYADRVGERIDAYLLPLAQRGEFAGTVLVARNDSVIFEKSYGLASVELGVPNSNDTRYRIFSVTKQFTAMATIVLAERGAVDLDASIRTYLPNLPASWQPVTVTHLLNHTSGLPQLEGKWANDFEGNTQLENLARIAPMLANDTLTAPPGTKWSYNNFGYDLLGCIVEAASGKELSQFIRENIFLPAGMEDAGFDVRSEAGRGSYVAPAVVPRLAYGYNGSPTRMQSALPMTFASAGAGAMYATARDLFHYDRALNRNRIVSAAVLGRMITERFQVNPKFGYGYGWMVRQSTDGAPLIHQSGGTNGYMTDYARLPQQHLFVAVLSNLGFVDTDGVRKRIVELLSESSH